jgi:hypothetical protein
MRMEPLLFADENAPEWAFSKRKGVKLNHNSVKVRNLHKQSGMEKYTNEYVNRIGYKNWINERFANCEEFNELKCIYD